MQELRAPVKEYRTAEEERARAGLSREGFTALWLLKREGVPEPEGIARRMEEAFREPPHWRRSEDQERELRRALYRALKGSGVRDLPGWVERLLDLLRRAEP